MSFDALISHPWFSTSLIAFVALLLGMLMHRVGTALLLRVTRPLPTLHTLTEGALPVARWLLPLLALQAVWQAAPDHLSGMGGLRHFTTLALIFFFTWLVLRLIDRFADLLLARHPVGLSDDLDARRIHTQTRVLSRTAMVIAGIVGAAMMLMTFPGARQVGASLLASAGVIGVVGGLAAKPVFANLIAGLQIALTQPIHIDDVLIVEGEWGRVEEITGTYVVMRIWDERRLIIPLNYFIEKPFENWTRNGSQLLGYVYLHVDYAMPLAPLRKEVERLVRAAPQWDGRVFSVLVTGATEHTMQIRVLASAANSGLSWELRCHLREGVIDFMQREYPQYLPRLRIAAEAPSTSAEALPPTQASVAAGTHHLG